MSRDCSFFFFQNDYRLRNGTFSNVAQPWPTLSPRIDISDKPQVRVIESFHATRGYWESLSSSPLGA